jgi:hypothetical protein
MQQLAAAINKLKSRRINVEWDSTLAVPAEAVPHLVSFARCSGQVENLSYQMLDQTS